MKDRQLLIVALCGLLGGILPTLASGGYFVTGGPVFPGWGFWLVVTSFVLGVIGVVIGLIIVDEMVREEAVVERIAKDREAIIERVAKEEE